MKNKAELELLLTKYLNNQCSPSELEEVIALLTNSDHIKILPELYAKASNKFQSDFRMHQTHKEALWDQIKSETIESDRSVQGRLVPINQVIRIAASVLLFVAMAYFLSKYLGHSGGEEAIALMKTVESPYGKKSKLTLPDGSVVIMNSGTIINYPQAFAKNSREISITGEAFFDITRDESRPFIIKTENVITQVLGTSFNLKSYQEEPFELTLVTGKVKVASVENEHEQMTILPNYQVSFNRIDEGFKKQEVNVKEYMGWKEGVLVLNGDLQTISKSIERWYNKRIIFKTENIKGCRIEASYVNEYLDNVLKSLSDLMNFEYSIDGNDIILDGKGCK
ncbi:FecR family protein [Fulvivirgaceae bacterium BMA10]|uniref:FecR family protein n=1 Tax=Splendidivirga corallicola TaxID=3051826 RepID=A0ABT8KUE3_9BACT|nr:FecR family protein [Fulvivirgaceae bacterium BMA10]